MKKIFAMIAIGFTMSFAAQAADFSVLVQKTLPALAYIEVNGLDGRKSLGSGFFFDKRLVLTNAHVAAKSVRIFVKPGTMDMLFPAKVVRTGWETMTASHGGVDLAILEVDIPDGIYEILKISDSIPPAGSPILVMGAPDGLQETATSGIVSSIRSDKGVSYVHFSAPISGGSSGGPIVGMNGEVIGVSTRSPSKVDPTKQNINFGVSALSIHAFIDNYQAFNEWGGRFHLPTGTEETPTPLKPVAKVEQRQKESYLTCLGETSKGDQIYIDNRSIVRQSHMLSVWVRFALSDFSSKRIRVLPKYRNSLQNPEYLEVNYSFNLANKMFTLKTSVLHGDGKVIGREDYSESYVFMVPGTIQDKIFKSLTK